MTRYLVALTLGSLCCTSAAPAAAQEWTRFRGPNGTGISHAKTIPTEWTEDDFNWRIELPAGGHSSPVLWGDKIFLTCADDSQGGAAQRMAVCVDAKGGKILWTKSFKSTFHKKHRFNSFASASAAVDESHAYFTWSAPDKYTLLALDHYGNLVWERDLGPYVSQHSCGISPIVYKNLVILGNDQDPEDEFNPERKGKSFLIAVDRKTGETRWQVERNSVRVAYSTPMIYRPQGGADELIFNSQAHGLTSLNPADGRLNWEIAAVGDDPLLDKRSVSSPVLAAGLLTASCGSGAGGNYLVAVRPGNANGGAPQLVYKISQRSAAPYVPTPVAKDGLLFLWADRNIASCVDAASGEVHWVRRIGGNFFGSPVWVDGRLFCASAEGEMVVIDAAQEFKLLARNPLGEELCHTTPAVAGGRMYVRTYRHLISLGGPK